MELNNKELKCLIERAGALHGRLNYEIEESIKFCRFCSEHGRFCDVADQTPFEERERSIVIRDSLKQVQNILLFLQKLESWQLKERHEALTRLEESRLGLTDLVRRYQGKAPDVLRELNACFGNNMIQDCDDIVGQNLKDGDEPNLYNRWWNLRWPKSFGIALKFLVFSASMSYMVRYNNHTTGQLYSISRKKRQMGDSLLNVYHGMG
ncbi:hypothetical protein PanWU01x14_346830 [Parasponia andersonii]|uniref:Plastid division protein PDV n=1 Tax=Parasponia andersonii TaxID=3476 RepID=A0A2P5AC87_PARAD|nr:hypothetical protein PanWU01x14_346830 [Parasponia andersonii]